MFKILETFSSFYTIWCAKDDTFSNFLIVIRKLLCRPIWPSHPLCDHTAREKRLAWHFSRHKMTENNITAHAYNTIDVTASP